METIRANDGGCLLNADQFEYTKDELGRPVLNTKSGSGGDVTSVNGKTGAVVLSASDIGALDDTTVIPTKTSELQNDNGFITNSALTGYAKTSAIPTKVSELTNDSKFITTSGAPVQSVNTKTGAITLSASDVGAVPTTRTVAGHALSANVTLVKGDVGLGNVDNTSDANKPVSTATKTALDGKVPTTRKVNGKALSADITLTASDVGALASTTIAVPAFTADDNGKVLGVVDGALAWVSKT